MTSKRILLVEDELLIAQNEKRLLESLGYAVIGIEATGEEAIRIIEEDLPDLVLMDILLGGEIDGIEVAETIRSQYDVPVVFVTACAAEQFIERAKLTEPFGYVVKPFDRQSLASNIELALYKHTVDQKLRESEEKYRLAMDATQEGLWDWEVTTGNVYYSPGWNRILGIEFVGNTFSTWEDRIHPADKARILNTLQLHLTGETTAWNEEHRLRNADAAWTWVLVRGRVVKRDGDGKPLRMVGTIKDISDRKQAELEKEQLLHDMDERVQELQCMYGITEAIRKHTSLDDILHETVIIIPPGWHYSEYTTARIILDDKEYVETPFTPTDWILASDLIINNRYRGSVEVYYTKEFPELDEGPFLKHERNLIDGIAKTLSEAIERKNVEAELKHLVTHDALTGLYNRKILEQRVTNDIQRATRYERALSVFMIDIDHFKLINDTYGHQAGDTVLRSFAEVLNDLVRKTDYAARYGGEEFIVILTETPLSKAEELAERLCSDISEHSTPLAGGKELNITVSVGLASYPEHARSWEDLLKAADSAMYAAKHAGRNCVRVVERTI